MTTKSTNVLKWVKPTEEAPPSLRALARPSEEIGYRIDHFTSTTEDPEVLDSVYRVTRLAEKAPGGALNWPVGGFFANEKEARAAAQADFDSRAKP